MNTVSPSAVESPPNTPLKKKAFVIQAIGEKGTETRKRADLVFNSIIKPACEAAGYDAIRYEATTEGEEATPEDKLLAKTIAQPIISALNTYPLVIADLAAPPWDPNVMMMVGFRLAIGRPIIGLADKNSDPKAEIIPLNLRNVHIHQIDSAALTPEDVSIFVKTIGDHESHVESWDSHYPIIEFSYPLIGPRVGRFIYANRQAAEVYGLSNPDQMIGQPISEIDERLQQFIAVYQRDPYNENQMALIGKLVAHDEGPLTATVPLWFTEHTIKTQNHKIYWPILAQHRYPDESDEELGIVLRVLFIDVTDWDVIHPRQRAGREPLSMPALFRKIPKYEIPPKLQPFTHDVFLSYNSNNRVYANQLSEMLERIGYRVWFDTKDFGGGQGLAEELLKDRHYAVAVFGSRIRG
ncbi:MAG: TIR domain-containing protein [Gemmataceae bacterium]